MPIMKQSAIKGLCFGLTSGVITTLGMMVGLSSFTGSKLVVIGGILSIAIADSFSDALGLHISEESDNRKTEREVWAVTLAAFIAKLFFALTFVVPVIFLKLNLALLVSVIWGLFALIILNYFIARDQKKNVFHVIGEHVLIAIVVIIVTHYAGIWISSVFG